MKSIQLRKIANMAKNKINQSRDRINPFHCLLHPFDGFYSVGEERRGYLPYAAAIVIVFFFAAIFQRQNTGYIFNHNQLNELNIFLITLKTLVLFTLWVIGNWSVATWIEGEGKASEIAIVSAYAIIPYVASMIFGTLLSNVLVVNEGAFLHYLTVIGILWSSILMVIGLQIIHDYEFGKTMRSILLTIIAMLIIVFLSVLFYTLFQQAYVFVVTVMNELLFRI
jgi:hypothetical protein